MMLPDHDFLMNYKKPAAAPKSGKTMIVLSKFQMLLLDILFSMSRAFTNKEWFYATVDAQDALIQLTDYVWWESQMIGLKVELMRAGIVRHIGEDSGVNVYWRTTDEKPLARGRNAKERYKLAYAYSRLRWQAEQAWSVADYPVTMSELERETADDVSNLARMVYADLGDKAMAEKALQSFAAMKLGKRLEYAYREIEIAKPSYKPYCRRRVLAYAFTVDK